MARYVLLSTLTVEGRRTLHQHPERMQEVDNEIQTFGCKVLDQYAVLGPYDFVSVVEAPDNETIAHLAVDLGSRGTVQVMTLPAISIDEFASQLRRSEQLGHN
ncbi:MAG TPA: GYD domain-containing protein [Acidimicrobiales bacterium]|nr:GYD domain-containing protein [Acidimicrobiales bacterium]